MATPDVMQAEKNFHFIDHPKGENVKPREMTIEKKIDLLEGLTGNVSNRRTRRWINDRLLMELVPRLNAEEIRGLFAPPPWGDEVPLSAFCMTNGGEWDKFRSIDMDKEIRVIETLGGSSSKKKGRVDVDKMAVLAAWHRVNCRTREALRRSFLAELIDNYEACLRVFIQEGRDDDVLVLHVKDPFHRMLLHGVCEFYDLVSVTDAGSDTEPMKPTKIKKKKSGCVQPPNITLCNFLKMAKEGNW
ncbi:uncharacterized protein LOC141692375 isoform X1 [Apium graveolens]|uniref:uncharacterized protein LOC141692375 isoform X1 n=1 Tax=Apium graveolens TaxID=4045 RepID=UPI003D79B24F